MSADKEDCVYQAKLAEQAERYDGKTPFSLCTKMFDFVVIIFIIINYYYNNIISEIFDTV